MSEKYWDPPMSLAACNELTEINLPLQFHVSSTNIQDCSMLLSTVCSPHLHRITLTFVKVLPTSNDSVVPILLSFEWGVFEDALLGISSSSQGVIEVAMIFSVEDRTQSISESGFEAFLPRFREVGKVRLEPLWV